MQPSSGGGNTLMSLTSISLHVIQRTEARKNKPLLNTEADSAKHFNLTTALLSIFALLTACALTYLMITQTILQWEHRIKFPYWDMGAVVAFLDNNPSPSLGDLYRTFRDN